MLKSALRQVRSGISTVFKGLLQDPREDAQGWVGLFGEKAGVEVTDRNLVELSSEVWAYVCATYVANAVADQELCLLAHAGKEPRVRSKQIDSGEYEILSHPLLDLMHTPNPFQTQMEFICETQMFLDSTGDAYWMIIPNTLDRPEELRILPTQRVQIVLDAEGELAWYELYRGNGRALRIPPRYICHFRAPNIRDQYTGMGCLEAAYKSAMLMESMTDCEISLTSNNAIPPIVVKYLGGKLKREDRLALDAEWNAGLRGVRNAGKIKVTDADFDVKSLGLSPREMAYLQGKRWLREEICAAYRVPMSLVTSEQINLANAYAGAAQFARYGIAPRLTLIEQTINKEIIPFYEEPRIYVEYKSPIPEDKEFELKKTQAMVASGLYTPEELKERFAQ